MIKNRGKFNIITQTNPHTFQHNSHMLNYNHVLHARVISCKFVFFPVMHKKNCKKGKEEMEIVTLAWISNEANNSCWEKFDVTLLVFIPRSINNCRVSSIEFIGEVCWLVIFNSTLFPSTPLSFSSSSAFFFFNSSLQDSSLLISFAAIWTTELTSFCPKKQKIRKNLLNRKGITIN